MSTGPTNNPVPSDHPADARDNYQRLDEFVNSTENLTSPTRTGRRVLTLNRYNELVQPNIDGAEAAAISAANSAADAQGSVPQDYQGLWPDSGGSALKDQTYQTQEGGVPTGFYFTALQDTSVDPVSDNINWQRRVSRTDVNERVFNFDTLNSAINSNDLRVGYAVNIKEREAGVGNGAVWDTVTSSTVVANGRNIVLSLAISGLALVQREVTVDKYVHSENINTNALPVALEKNQVGANQDRWVMLFGDSHGWGQGAPDWDTFSGSVNFSTHSSFPHSKGFMRRIENFLRDKLQINENTFNLGHPDVSGRIQPMDASSGFMLDIEKSYPLRLQSGFLTSAQTNLVDVTGNTISEFYSPLAKFNTDAYSLTEYREKLSTSMFKDMLMKLRIETDDEFLTTGKDYFVDMIPNPSYAGSGGTHTQITFGSESVIFAEYNNSSGAFFLVSKSTSNFPEWFAVGALAYLPGYGIIKITSILGNGAIQVTNEDSSQIGAGGAGYITTSTRLYHPSYVNTAILRAEMVAPARVSYIHVRHQSNGANLRIAFTDSISGGLALHPYLNEGVQFRGSANKWNPKFSDFNPSVSLVGPGHILSTASKVSTDTQGVSIDTSQITPSVDEEVIYRIDWGSKQQGALHLSCVEQTPGDGTSVETRGIVFDNNKVVNHSMGGHTVGAWIGQQSNTGNTETRDHVNDILNYTPVRPSHVIVQIPFVNEYLKQTSIVDFSNYLQSFVDKFINHMAATNNYNLVGTDFLFFTSLRNKEIGFEGAAESAITYDDYVQATKEFCSDNDHAFVDCEQRLFDLVDQGRVDYQRLYNDSNHPSDYANEMIFDALKGEFIYAQMG
jgi:hypothetical protein